MTKLDGFNKPVALSNKWSGYNLTDIEKVGIAALALGTISPEAIKDLTGVSKRTIKWSISVLKETHWDIEATLEMQSGDRVANVVYNQDAYPILRQKGVFPCE